MKGINFILVLLISVKFETSHCLGEEFKEANFLFVNGRKNTDNVIVEFNNTKQLLQHPDFHHDRYTMLYCHGYTEDYNAESTQLIVDAYLWRNDHNILVLQWSKYSVGNYILQAVPNTVQLGAKVGKVLVTMQKIGFDLTKFHIIGHSLGGHMAGFIGRSVIKNSNNKLIIPRITALDPAGPMFYPPIIFIKPINKNDAKFVDVIHGDALYFGTKKSTGTVDFWPNEGRNQPGCPPFRKNEYLYIDNFCSHQRSWRFYAESVKSNNSHVFDSIKCSSWIDFVNGNCHKVTSKVYMGYGANENLSGNYYLQTNSASMYSRDQLGTNYTKM